MGRYDDKDYTSFCIIIDKELLAILDKKSKEEGRAKAWYVREGLKKMGIKKRGDKK